MKDYNYNKIYCNQVIEGFRLDRSLQLGEATQGGRSDCGCAYAICNDFLSRFKGFCGSNPCISVGFLGDHTIWWGCLAYLLAWGKRPSLWSFLLHTSFGWEDNSSLFTWWFGIKKGCGDAGSCALHLTVNDGPGSCVWNLMNQGSSGGVVRGSSGFHLFPFVHSDFSSLLKLINPVRQV